MEILGYLSSFMLAIMLVMVVIQLVMGYAMQSIAKKNEMSSLAETLAWLPILNIYPFIVCGGGSFPRFLAGFAAFFVASIAVAFGASMLGEGVAPIVSGIIGAAGGLAMLLYFGRLLWRTAERRGLSGFIGLLNFVPGVNFFVYPYIAFHDGLVPVNKVGAALGFILIAGPMVAQYQLMGMAGDVMQAQMLEMEEADLTGTIFDPAGILQQGDQTDVDLALASSSTPPPAASPEEIAVGTKLAELNALDPSDPANAARLREQFAQARQGFAQIEASLPEDRAESLRQELAQAQLRLVDVHVNEAPDAVELELVAANDFNLAGTSSEAAPFAAPAAAAFDAVATAWAELPAAVSHDMSCESGTERRDDPIGQSWCQRPNGGLKHGWWSDRHPNSERAQAGRYRDGLRHGVWTRWYEDGRLRVQAEFDRGLQHGYLVAWDRSGIETARILFEDGSAIH